MGLLLWACIITVLILLDRLLGDAEYHNRRGYQRRKKMSMARR